MKAEYDAEYPVVRERELKGVIKDKKKKVTATYCADKGIAEDALTDEDKAEIERLSQPEFFDEDDNKAWDKSVRRWCKPGGDADIYITHLCNQRLKWRFPKEDFKFPAHETDVGKRMYKEINCIRNMNVAGYLLIVWDFINWSREHGIPVGPGRGSAAGDSGIASFDGESGLKVSLENDIKINEFVVEARVKPTQFGTMQNIIVAEPPGRGVDGWIIRIDNGVLTVHLRDTEKDYDDWNVFPGKEMVLNEWCEIRLERSADSVKLFQDGEVTVAVAYTGDLTQMAYDWSIGYDGMQQAFHDRYFIGEMDYIRFGVFKGFTEGAVVAKNEWLLAAWEFNEPKFVGLDRMANNSTKE